MATTKVEANISNFLDYTSTNYYTFSTLAESLSNLKWNTLLYDETIPSYNLSFNAPKTTDNPAGTFTINHKVTGDYIDYFSQTDPLGSIENGTLSDNITASYGTIDKFKLSYSKIIANKTDKNGDTISKSSQTKNQSITSSNGTLEDKNDDYVLNKSSTQSSTQSSTTVLLAGALVGSDLTSSRLSNFKETYKSKSLNYSDIKSLTKISNGYSVKLSYSGSNTKSGVSVTSNVIYDDVINITDISQSIDDLPISIYENSKNFSSAAFKLTTSSGIFSLNFSGKFKETTTDYTSQTISYNLKNFNLETSDLKMISENVISAIEFTEDYPSISEFLYSYDTSGHNLPSLINSSFPIEEEKKIKVAIDTFLTLTQGEDTITAKNNKGIKINAGDGKDVVVGGAGNDMIIGGEGSDKLTGGKGADTFSFSKSDFYTTNSNGDLVFNKSADTITDFNVKDNDVLNFIGLGNLSFYTTLDAAKAEKAQFFYAKDSGNIYLNTTSNGYTPTIIITLTEKPAIKTDNVNVNRNVSSSNLLFPKHSMGEWKNYTAFAAIKADGSVVTWGFADWGGDSSSVADKLDGKIDVVQVFSSSCAFAALRADGSVVTWGDSRYGGDSSNVADQLDGTIDVVKVFSSGFAFAALREDGSVVTWGGTVVNSYFDWGGDSSSVADKLDGKIDVVQVFSNYSAFAALRADGSIITWGGGIDSNMPNELDGRIDVVQVFSTQYAFAALRADGSVVTWGNSKFGGDDSSVEHNLNSTIHVIQVFSNYGAFAALRADGSVVTWGDSTKGGDSSSVTNKIDGNIDTVQIFSNYGAFAALRADGSVVTWGDANTGGDSSSVIDKLNGKIDVIQVFSNYSAFAALREDGSVVTWGDANDGGESSSVALKLDGTIDVMRVFSTAKAFAALRADGSVVTWGADSSLVNTFLGYARFGGNSSSVADQLDGTIDVVEVFSNDYSFAALRADGSIVTWGGADWGGDSSSVATELSSGVLTLSNIEDNTNLIFPVGVSTINSI
jgi:hypothetical protein